MDAQKLARSILILGLVMHHVATQEKKQRIIAACNYDSDCIANAFCKEQTYCECKKDFIYYETGRNFSCLQEALLLGDGCQADIQCTKPFGIHAHCLTTKTSRLGKCECMAGAHFKEGRCYETAVIGEKCLVSNNCYLTSGVTAYCEKSVCVCPNHYHPTQNGRDCIKTVYLDEPCQNDLECVTPNSRCGDVCRCRVNYIQSRQNNSCIRAADNMGDPCVENEQCTMFLVRAECGVNGRCRCTEGFHYIPPNSKCFRDIALDDMCEEAGECVANGAICDGGICRCGPNFSPNDDNSQCIGRSGQQASTRSSFILLISLIFLRIFNYLIQELR